MKYQLVRRTYSRRAALSGLLAMGVIAANVLGGIGILALPRTASAYEFVEGYYNPASNQIVPGMYVSKVGADGLVTATKTSNADAALGVASEESGGLLTLTSKESNVFVATSGTLPVFITDIAGTIKTGDLLAASSIPGVLKKATDEDSYILGIARDTFDKSKNTSSQSLELLDSQGDKSNVSLGLVSIDIKRFANPGKIAKNPLQRAGESIVRKPVSMLQIIFGGSFFLISVISILVLVSTAVRSSISSIGRNPLAKKSILHGLYQILALATLILITGLAGTYIILWI